jgi:hypothetical protein
MGIDFIRKAAPSFRKGLDRRRIELATPNLFTQEPTSAPRACAAQLRGDKPLAVGEKLGVRLDGQNVLATRGLELVAVFKSPTADLTERAFSIVRGGLWHCSGRSFGRPDRGDYRYADATTNIPREPAQPASRAPALA